MENNNLSDASLFKRMIKNHSIAFILFLFGVIGALIGAFFVFYFTIQNTWIGGYGTWNIGEFSIGTSLGLLIIVILFEFLLVGLPFVAYEGILFYLWWSRLPQEEKDMIKERDKREKQKVNRDVGGSVFSFIVTLVFLLLVFLQGNWDTPFSDLSFMYWINTWFLAFLMLLLIAGIPGLIGGVWYIVRQVE
ncbi:MAG: hypothetical protein EU541_04620 [Promethearchaeota archaeon]|nr:MAG: hypothetical protein EU541_04620 [Candidatus Lokiarchaeota archaeon]